MSLGKKCVVGAERRALQGWRDCLGHGPSSECISSCLSPHLKATGSIVQGGSLWAFCNCLSITVISLIDSVLSMKVKIKIRKTIILPLLCVREIRSYLREKHEFEGVCT